MLSRYNTVKTCLEDCCVSADNMHKLSLYLHQIPIMKHTDILRISLNTKSVKSQPNK